MDFSSSIRWVWEVSNEKIVLWLVKMKNAFKIMLPNRRGVTGEEFKVDIFNLLLQFFFLFSILPSCPRCSYSHVSWRDDHWNLCTRKIQIPHVDFSPFSSLKRWRRIKALWNCQKNFHTKQSRNKFNRKRPTRKKVLQWKLLRVYVSKKKKVFIFIERQNIHTRSGFMLVLYVLRWKYAITWVTGVENMRIRILNWILDWLLKGLWVGLDFILWLTYKIFYLPFT